MTDYKITQLTENTTPAASDIFPMVDDPSGSPTTQKISMSNFLKVINGLTEDTAPDTSADFILSYDTSASAAKKVKPTNLAIATNGGWVTVVGTWTYATANTVTIPTDGTTTYKKGMGIRWKQGGSYKYAYITIVASTLLTVTGGTDYTVANAAITDMAYTFSPKTAIGFPLSFSFTSTPSRGGTPYTNPPTLNSASYSIIGNKVEGSIDFTMAASAGGTGEVYWSPPTTIATNRYGFGIEVASTAKPFIVGSPPSAQVLVFYDIAPPAVISTTSGYHYVGSFEFLI